MIKREIKKQAYEVTFQVTFENAETVVVLGDFNEWNHDAFPLKKKKNNQFEGKFSIPSGRDYHFRYLINGSEWANDEHADRYETSPLLHYIQNSVLSLPKMESAPAATTATKVAAKAAAPKPAKKEAAKPAAGAKPTADKAPAAKKATAKPATAKVAPKATKAAPKAAPIKVADDLTKIEGIGPKIAGLLINDGIMNFADLSKAKQTTLTAILEKGGSRYKMHDPSTWPQQAKLANAGKWDELAKLQDELQGGKAKK